jgi:2,3-diketo-5-methylthio-1-phosphopentane phosphatase
MIEPWQIAQLMDGDHAALPLAMNWVVQCDFNGIVSLEDTTHTLLQRFGRPGWQALEEARELGAIDARECMESQVALLNMSREELNAHLDSLVIDPHFSAFVKSAQRRGVQLQIVSDGMDYAIRRILSGHGLGHLPIAANGLVQIGERNWQLLLSRANTACVRANGSCRCERLVEQRPRYSKVFFVGGASSDFCATGKADFVLARGRLAAYCKAQGLSHALFTGFAKARAIMEDVTRPLHANPRSEALALY